jgi:hypothetical protein
MNKKHVIQFLVTVAAGVASYLIINKLKEGKQSE